ncbi:MAG TPA: DUF6282 family protein, partial [Thermoplasmataceae archaeon]|nr:DUF6282 family protein [Thermoplasmataceae archaeon]
GMLRAPIKAVDESGKLLPEVDEILDLIRDYGMIMATGHLSVAESIMVIKRAKQRGVDKIVVTHPEFPTTNFTISQQKDLLQYKVYFERCYTTPATGKVEWDYVFKEVVETRPERNILSTDLGQPNAILPTEGMERFVSFFKERGLSDDDIHKMVVENQQKLLFD